MDLATFRVGTAGWSVPARYAGELPPGGSHLERYARRLPAVEINTSFYRPHQRKTYQRWSDATPPGFLFSVKVPKTVTHERRLVDCGVLLDRFCSEIAGLGKKLGVLLVQLPPSLAFDARIAHDFFAGFPTLIDVPVVVEPRHASWFSADVDAALADLKIARVAADPARAPHADRPGGWRGLSYYRWHGSPRMYYSDYDAAALIALHRSIHAAQAGQTPVWCVFDNTASGAALGNALALDAMLRVR